jgi:hypothetical protein
VRSQQKDSVLLYGWDGSLSLRLASFRDLSQFKQSPRFRRNVSDRPGRPLEFGFVPSTSLSRPFLSSLSAMLL